MFGFESITLDIILWIVFAVTISGFIQGTLGFGFPFLATPMVAMITDMRTAVITILLPTLSTTIATLFTCGSLKPVLRRFWMMPVYAFTGALAGTWLFVGAPAFPYQLLLAAIILIYLNLDRLSRGAWPLIRRHERAFGPLAGAAAGLFEGTANVAAPPLIIYYLALGLAPAMLVPALQICFFIGKTTQFSVLTFHGGVTMTQWAATLPLVVCAIVGVLGGARVRGRIDAETYRRWVKRALLVIAFALLAQYVYLHWLR
jgi:uncharacterized membrane protein YfcA